MKKIYFLLLALCFTLGAYAQDITFADANLKAKLLEASPFNYIAKNAAGDFVRIDTNLDGEIQLGEAALIYHLQIAFANITNLDGLTNFVNLHELQCQGNQLNVLDVTGLPNLTSLLCFSSQINVLNLTGLTNLTTLDCSANHISVLAVSGITSLTQLNCGINNLTTLDVTSLINLTSLSCDHNQLSSIDVSSLTNLIQLDCSGNQLSSLNVLPLINLTDLKCYTNHLTSLNLSGLTNLVHLECMQNQITSMDVSSLINIQTFAFSDNQITSINLNGLTQLNQLECTNNQLSSLNLSGLDGIWYLYCAGNQLTSLNVSNLGHLYELRCSDNQLTALDFSNNDVLFLLNCSGNPLTSLNLEPTHMEDLTCDNMPQLTTINIKTGVNAYNLSFANNPSLRYVCTHDAQVAAIEGLISGYGYSDCHVNSYCSFTPGGIFYRIQGNNKFDSNANGCDVSDLAIPNLKYGITNGTITGSLISNASGNYSIPVQSGTHTVTPIFENPTYFNVSPASVNVTFPAQASPFNQNFCLTPNGVHPDLEITLLPIAAARPGFDAIYKIIYKNKGNTTQTGTVNLAFNDLVTDFVSAMPTVTTQTLNNLSWDFTNLQPFETREITVTLNVNSPMETPAVNGGDILNYTTTISSAASDDLPADNTFTFDQTVVNSFDPNDKTCLEGATISPSEVGKYVHYMIRFENTGTFQAENIVVKDMIDTNKFDINSLVPIKGSHPFVTNITAGNKVEFIFENINLPFDDANNDGYVAFKIKTKPTLVVGNTFSNTANIYFDYNFPIVTNTATTTIAALSTQDFGFESYFSLYPNPVNDVLNIETKQAIEVSSINIYNQLGQLVLVVPNAQNVSTVDVSSLASGNYFIKINSDKGTSNTKFIKN